MTSTLEVFKSAEGRAAYLAAYEALLRKWPVHYDTFTAPTRLGRTHVITAGPDDAPPIALLPAVSVSSTAWFANVQGLSQHYRVYAIDTIGDAGKSVLEKMPQHPSEYAGWLGDVFDRLYLSKMPVIGHSYGGWLALNVARYAPERVTKLVLLAPSAGIHRFKLPIWILLRLAGVLPFRSGARRTLESQTVSGYVLDETFIQLMEVVSKSCWSKVLFPSVLSDADLRRITTPTLLLLGEQEVLYDPAKAMQRAERLMPNLVGKWVPNASHLLTMEQPEVVNAHVHAFLSEP